MKTDHLNILFFSFMLYYLEIDDSTQELERMKRSLKNLYEILIL